MSAHGNENAEVETGIIEDSEENSFRFSPELVDETIKVSLEPLHAQISALTEMMDRLIQSNSTTEPTTANSRGPDTSTSRLAMKDRHHLSLRQ